MNKEKQHYEEIKNEKFCEIYKEYIGLIKSIASKYTSYSKLPLNTLINFGLIGLREAYETFDENRNVKFSTYAYPYIENSIKNEAYNTISLISIPKNVNDDINKINKFINKYKLENAGQSPTQSQIKDYMNLNSKKIYTDKDINNLNCDANTKSIVPYASFKNEDEDNINDIDSEDYLYDEGDDPRYAYNKTERIDEINMLCSILSKEEYIVISSTFGINNIKKISEYKLSKLLHYDIIKIRKIYEEGMNKIKNYYYKIHSEALKSGHCLYY